MPKRLKTITIFLILGLILFNLGRQIKGALQAGERLDRAADELLTLQQDNTKLKAKLAEVQGYDTLERAARQELNLGKAGETVVVIPKEEIDKVLAAEKKPVEVKLPNWQGWLRLIFH